MAFDKYIWFGQEVELNYRAHLNFRCMPQATLLPAEGHQTHDTIHETTLLRIHRSNGLLPPGPHEKDVTLDLRLPWLPKFSSYRLRINRSPDHPDGVLFGRSTWERLMNGLEEPPRHTVRTIRVVENSDQTRERKAAEAEHPAKFKQEKKDRLKQNVAKWKQAGEASGGAGKVHGGPGADGSVQKGQ